MTATTVEIGTEEIKCWNARAQLYFEEMAEKQGQSVATAYAIRSIHGSIHFLRDAIDTMSLCEILSEARERLLAEEVDKARGKTRQ